MSYNSLTSKQIISNEGELSIDVFNSFDNPDTSSLKINCNSYLNDGISLNCLNGGIKTSCLNLDFNSKNTNFKCKDYSIECIDELRFSSLNCITLNSMNKIDISINKNDGLFIDSKQGSIDLINKNYVGNINVLGNNILIGNENNNSKLDDSKYNIKFEDSLLVQSKNHNFIEIDSESQNIVLDGNVFVKGKLQFSKLETVKISKYKLDGISNILEFGENDKYLSEWKILGHHLNKTSELRFNYHSSSFELNFNKNPADLKIGNLCITNESGNVFKTDNNDVLVENLISSNINTDSIHCNFQIHCSDIIVKGKSLSRQEDTIFKNISGDLTKFILDKNFVLIDCDLENDFISENNCFKLIGHNKIITWSKSYINIRNVTDSCCFENINFHNMNIYAINCVKLSFLNCNFVNSKMVFEKSEINIEKCNIDNNSSLSGNILKIYRSIIRCMLVIKEKFQIVNSDIYLNQLSKICFENKFVIYHINNNFIYCSDNLEYYFNIHENIVLLDNWIIYKFNNTKFERNIIIKKFHNLK